MKLPKTDHLPYQYAFKKGYRMALDGKTLVSMPSEIRRDMAMRDYFQQGWEQAVNDQQNQLETLNKPNWKRRFTWMTLMALGGIATGYQMIYNFEQEQNTQTVSVNDSKQNPNTTNTINPDEAVAKLGLLTPEQRQDLSQLYAQSLTHDHLTLDPVQDSNVHIKRAFLSEPIKSDSPQSILKQQVPKYIRQVRFFTQISTANNGIMYHRWRTASQVIQNIKHTVAPQQKNVRLSSEQTLTSAWQGQWYVELLDENKHVIYRQAFTYGKH